jgi:flagellar M-ring protein FliF
MESLRVFVRTLGPVRLAVLGSVALVLAGFFVWMIARAAQPPMALLFGDLEISEAAKITAQLDAARVPYQISAGGSAVLVAADQVARTRMTLAEQGLPSGGSIGYEIFDGSNALGSTNFQQNINLVRALEGELSRTIRGIAEVKAARVHLVLPQRELFSREKPKASASVLLQMRGRNRLTPAQVAAIQQLIASAVPSLATGRISIVDNMGTLLSEANEGADPVAGAAAKADQRRRSLETHLSQTIEQLVERTVGPGKVRAEVSVEMDFDRIDSSEEIFDPEGQVVRSTQTVDHSNSNRQLGSAAVSVATNLPDGQPASPPEPDGELNAEKRSEETVNYEISKKVINHVREAGIIKHLSVAVLVDGVTTVDDQGQKVHQPRSAEDLQQLTTLIRGAVGYNAERGDKVEVVSMRFADTELPETSSEEGFLGLEKQDLFKLAEYGALLLLAILALLLVVRPIVTKAVDTVARSQVPPQADLLAATPANPALTGPGGSLTVATASDSALEEMIDISRVEGRVKASSVKRVSEIVEKHPEESLAILRSWMHSGR